jgi:hypothetical protein
VGGEAELAEECVEETTPFVVVWLSELEENRNMGLDVHGLEDRCGRGVGGGNIDVDGGSEGCVGGVRVGLVGIEEGILIHGGHGGERAPEMDS